MNKKGFATSAILYTMLILFLTLMLSILYNLEGKKNILDNIKKDIVDKYECGGTGCVDACKVDIGTEYNFDYTGGEQSLIVPCTGNYKLEVWGAQGGDISGYTGGRGGFATGEKSFEKNKSLFINVGGAGIGATGFGQNLSGGYNGGGFVTGNSTVNHITASGGGATHISFLTGTLATIGAKNLNQIMIVAGGGGGARNQSNHVSAARWGNGGSGGGISGTGAQSSNGSTTTLTVMSACAGTQTNGFSFGQGEQSTTNSGGGGGLYGGYGGSGVCGYTGPGSGGSGYIGELMNGTTNNGLRNGNGYAKITYLGK